MVEDFGATDDYASFRLIGHISDGWTFAMHINHDHGMGKLLESWRLFRLLAFAISAAICIALPATDFRSAHGTEFIILYSVRCALPFFIVAFTASSLAILWPSRTTRWLLSNRRYFGLAFALGMGWHLTFVVYTTVRFGNHLNRMATMLDLFGLAFLLALTVTSFRAIAHRLSPASWRRLHKSGVYAIWLLATYIYVAGVRDDADLFHIIALSVFVASWLLRVAAWTRIELLRRSQSKKLSRCSA
jgi:sulfoxide reductase heme-binding subunit YedZ